MEEVVFGELFEGVSETKEDAADADNHECGAARVSESEDEVRQINPSPDCGPGCWKLGVR